MKNMREHLESMGNILRGVLVALWGLLQASVERERKEYEEKKKVSVDLEANERQKLLDQISKLEMEQIQAREREKELHAQLDKKERAIKNLSARLRMARKDKRERLWKHRGHPYSQNNTEGTTEKENDDDTWTKYGAQNRNQNMKNMECMRTGQPDNTDIKN